MQSQTKDVLRHYDEPKLMGKNQLELAWFFSIWENPNHARKTMLNGLDGSMFEDKWVFDTGLNLLRDKNFSGDVVDDDELLTDLMNRKMTSTFSLWSNEGYFIPAFYKIYCKEIEERSRVAPTPSWS